MLLFTVLLTLLADLSWPDALYPQPDSRPVSGG
jgi:hypothetical protein